MFRVGIAGAGYIGIRHAEAYARLPGATVAAVCDTRADAAAALATRCGAAACGSLDEVFALGIDALDICLPTHLHYPVAAAALERGFAVLCEKPMALRGEDALAMLRLSRSRGVPLMVGHTMRFDARWAALKRCLEEGAYGRLRALRLHRHSPVPSWSAGSWITDRERSGGLVLDLHIHDTDAACWLLGPPEWVFSKGDDFQMVTLYGYEGVCVTAEASWRPHQGFPFEHGFDAVMERATIRFDGECIYAVDDGGKRMLDPLGMGVDAGLYCHDDPLANEIAYFLRCMQGNLPFDICTAESSLTSLGIVEAERESIASGLIIKTA